MALVKAVRKKYGGCGWLTVRSRRVADPETMTTPELAYASIVALAAVLNTGPTIATRPGRSISRFAATNATSSTVPPSSSPTSSIGWP